MTGRGETSRISTSTIGDWRDAVKLVFPADRWTEIKKQKGASGVQAWDVGVVAPEVIEEPGLL